MSIFKVHDINLILFELLDIDDLRNLYQVNTYYRKSLYATLCSFFIFYANINSIKLPKEIKNITLFNKSIVFGNLTICKYLYRKNNINIHINGNEYAIICCIQGHFDILQWLDSIGINMHRNYDVFKMSCKYGHIEIIKYLQLLGANRYDSVYFFRLACEMGHIKAAKYLHSKPHDINIFIYYDFAHACMHGNIKVAKLLYSISTDFILDTNAAFITACEYGHIEIARWLYAIDVFTDDDYNNAFRESCQYGHIKIAKWLNYIYEFTDNNRNTAFTIACKYGHIEIAKWLYGLGAFLVDDYDIIREMLHRIVVDGNFKIILWISYFMFKISCSSTLLRFKKLLDYMTFNA